MGGETRGSNIGQRFHWGPSPRGRGNPPAGETNRACVRSIPAWAGKPIVRIQAGDEVQVHPRVGGETGSVYVRMRYTTGPSPRGRGNQSYLLSSPLYGRSIPAWAGKPCRSPSRISAMAVHPRVGGETFYQSRRLPSCIGPSPRGRGNRGPWCYRRVLDGSIPAWAGKPSSNSASVLKYGVHPRVGGETVCAIFARSIPRVHPRVGGETRDLPEAHPTRMGPSPRGRGNPTLAIRATWCYGSIPAWAGKPAFQGCLASGVWVHPRVGGETRGDPAGRQAGEGPSPRGRGNPPLNRPRPAWGGSIPAWAGKPVACRPE